MNDVVSIREIQAILFSAMSHGIEVGPLLAAGGLDFPDLADPDRRVSYDSHLLVFAEALRRSGDPHFGLHLGEMVAQLPMPSVLRQALLASSTVGDGLKRLIRFGRLIHAEARFSLDQDGDAARLVHHPDRGPVDVTRHFPERLFAGVLCVTRQLAGSTFGLREVAFAFKAPASIDELSRVFQAPMRFGQPVSTLTFDRAHLDLPFSGADPDLLCVLDAHMATVVSPEVAADTAEALGPIKQHIADALADGVPALSVIAVAMRTSSRSLQRRIADAGTNYRVLVAEVQRDLAKKHLAAGELALCEVAFAVGFSELSPFHRAFKRWTAQTPLEFRRRPRTH